MTSTKPSGPTASAEDNRQGCVGAAIIGSFTVLAVLAGWYFLAALRSVGDAPPAAITFKNESERTIGVVRGSAESGLADSIRTGPTIVFVVPKGESSRGWGTEQPDALCEHPDVVYFIVGFDLRPDLYVPGETSAESFTLLETVGPGICWDSKNPAYTFSG